MTRSPRAHRARGALYGCKGKIDLVPSSSRPGCSYRAVVPSRATRGPGCSSQFAGPSDSPQFWQSRARRARDALHRTNSIVSTTGIATRPELIAPGMLFTVMALTTRRGFGRRPELCAPGMLFTDSATEIRLGSFAGPELIALGMLFTAYTARVSTSDLARPELIALGMLFTERGCRPRPMGRVRPELIALGMLFTERRRSAQRVDRHRGPELIALGMLFTVLFATINARSCATSRAHRARDALHSE